MIEYNNLGVPNFEVADHSLKLNDDASSDSEDDSASDPMRMAKKDN